MTQPTIKDWIEKNTFEIGSYPYEVLDKKLLSDFARLICEEMTESSCGCGRAFLEQKAQEILKALERYELSVLQRRLPKV